MKTLFFTILFALSAVISITAQADSEKRLNLGLGTYAMTIAYNDPLLLDYKFSGRAASALYAPSNRVAIRGTFYSMNNDDLSALKNTGFDMLFYYGKGFIKPGLKAFFGGGLFSESWEVTGFSENFSGFQLSGGVGFNWDEVSLDLTVAVRDPADYDTLILGNINFDPVAVSSSLILSARF